MGQQRQYIFLTGVIFVVQVGLYFLFSLSQGDSKVLSIENELLTRKNKILMVEMEQYKEHVSSLKKQRGLASIEKNAVSYPVDLSNFYFVQVDQTLAKGEFKKALDFLDKIKQSSYDSDILAKAQHFRIKIICNKKLEFDCIHEIEEIVSQFPDSRWAGESLLLLSRYYYELNKHQEAKQILEIVKKDFKQYSELKMDDRKPLKKQL